MCSINYYNLCGCGGVSRFFFQSFQIQFKFETLFLILERFTLLGCNITDFLALWWIVPRLQIARAEGNEDQSCRDVGACQDPEDNLPLMVGIL